ncbi:uncharacterized protein A4U43_C06F17440 [Asparagus officinalis]|uniref:Uncharacterized protein n=1 Tax=Asparagus officinalis TaxID=4686 RepID=A0A5P1EPY1_ASPOF|nr:uncharacterized protein A4U43_C06F17440 [Asparagus officinalis]
MCSTPSSPAVSVSLPLTLEVALLLKKNPLKNSKGEDSSSRNPVLAMKPRKWLRGDLVPEKLNNLWSRMTEIATKLDISNSCSQMEKLDKKRRRLSKGQGSNVSTEKA